VGNPVPPPRATTRRSDGAGVEKRLVRDAVSTDSTSGDGDTV
jgi:hypothetical protein